MTIAAALLFLAALAIGNPAGPETGLLPFSAAVAAEAPTFQELEESLTCQCGCGLTVHSCNHLQCGSALPLRDEIRAQMKLSQNKEEILGYFSNKYGEKILSSPTTTGFNLAAWVTPFILLMLGGGVVVVFVRRWGRSETEAPPAAPRPPDKHREQLERELKEYKD